MQRDVPPLLTHCSYISFAWNHWCLYSCYESLNCTEGYHLEKALYWGAKRLCDNENTLNYRDLVNLKCIIRTQWLPTLTAMMDLLAKLVIMLQNYIQCGFVTALSVILGHNCFIATKFIGPLKISGDCYRIHFTISQYWFKWWLGVVRGKTLPEAMLTQVYGAIWCHETKMSQFYIWHHETKMSL